MHFTETKSSTNSHRTWLAEAVPFTSKAFSGDWQGWGSRQCSLTPQAFLDRLETTLRALRPSLTTRVMHERKREANVCGHPCPGSRLCERGSSDIARAHPVGRPTALSSVQRILRTSEVSPESSSSVFRGPLFWGSTSDCPLRPGLGG